jgi:hypothetical protein
VEDDLLQRGATPPDERECRLYRFVGRDPWNRGIGDVLLYLGESAREPFVRMLEHIYEQEFAPLIRGWYVDKRAFASKAEVLIAEEHAIRTEQPIYNYEHNLDNPWRIDTRGQRRRAPKVYRASPAARWRPTRPAAPRRRRSWRWLRSPAAFVVSVWLVLAGAGWWVTDHYLRLAAGADAVTGAAAAGMLLAGAAGLRAKRRHRWRWRLLCAVLAAGWLIVVADWRAGL